jgi:hypothetical protein
MNTRQKKIRIFAEAFGGAIYNTMLKAARQLEEANLPRQPYNDDE